MPGAARRAAQVVLPGRLAMDIVNRSAVFLRPRHPYLEWTKLDDKEGLADSVFETMRTDPALYLLPAWEDDDEEREVVREFWPALFEEMLEGWVLDESMWPTKRTYEMFQEWFDVETHSMLVDICQDDAIGYLE